MKPSYPTIFITEKDFSTKEIKEKISEYFDIKDINTTVINEDDKTIKIDEIRDFKKEVLLTGAKDRLFIFLNFHKATLDSQNAMLKILEEYGPTHGFALVSYGLEMILPTIISRCRIDLSLKNTVQEDFNLEKIIEGIEMIRSGKTIEVLSQAEFQVSSLEEAQVLFLKIITALRKFINSKDQWYLKSIKKALNQLNLSKRNNLSAQLSIDEWIIYSSKI